MSFSLDSREAVDEVVRTALTSGGTPSEEAQDYGFMYTHSFQDPDGHLWEVFWMDPAGPPQGRGAVTLTGTHGAGRPPAAGYASIMSGHVWLLPLKNLDDDARAIKLGEIADWSSPRASRSSWASRCG